MSNEIQGKMLTIQEALPYFPPRPNGKAGMTYMSLLKWVESEKCPFGVMIGNKGHVFEERMIKYFKGELS